MNTNLEELCVYVMWELESKDSAVWKLMRKDGPHIPLGWLLQLAAGIVNGTRTCAASRRILAHAVADRLENK